MRFTKASVGVAVGAVLGLGALAPDGPAGASNSTPHSPAARLAHRELLTASAYPKGWKPQGSGSSTPQAGFYVGIDSGQVTQLTICLGVSSNGIVTTPAEAAGQAYADNNSALEVTDTVEVYPSAAGASADVAGAANPKAPGCMDSLAGSDITSGILSGFGKGATATGPLSVTAPAVPGLNGKDAVIELSQPVSYQGISGPFINVTVYVPRGRSESVLNFTNQGTRPSNALLVKLANEAYARM